jgi:hypothetical protein
MPDLQPPLQHLQTVLLHGHQGLPVRDFTWNRHTTSAMRSHTVPPRHHDLLTSTNRQDHIHLQYHTPSHLLLHQAPNRVSSPCSHRRRRQNLHNFPTSQGKHYGHMPVHLINLDTVEDNPRTKQITTSPHTPLSATQF